MTRHARYAIYFIPAAESELYRFGCSVLGYDCYTGEGVPFPDGLDPNGDWHDLTAEPRRYGFHATLKAPFHLSPSSTEAQLINAFLNFAMLGHQVAHMQPVIRALGDFIAIVPREPSQALNDLANKCTMIFDAFRAPITGQERARRMASRPSPNQMQNLDRWGYPYVFEDFRFHMTLTGRVPSADRNEVIVKLRRLFDPMSAEREFAVNRLALVKQSDTQACFRVLSQAELG